MSPQDRIKLAARILGRRGGMNSRINLTEERKHEIAVNAGKASGEARKKKRLEAATQ